MLRPVRPHVCIGRVYNRLNEDDQPLHALSHFFLEHTGPSHEMGNHRILPFLVDMAQLYERFVAEWLTVALPPEVHLRVQERLHLDAGKRLHFIIDLVLYDVKTGETRCVIDTKHKIEFISIYDKLCLRQKEAQPWDVYASPTSMPAPQRFWI